MFTEGIQLMLSSDQKRSNASLKKDGKLIPLDVAGKLPAFLNFTSVMILLFLVFYFSKDFVTLQHGSIKRHSDRVFMTKAPAMAVLH
jgi:hypothetical protein